MLLLLSLAWFTSACQTSIPCSQPPSAVAHPRNQATDQGNEGPHTTRIDPIARSITAEHDTGQLENLPVFPEPKQKTADRG